jgi:hypothetical protein
MDMLLNRPRYRMFRNPRRERPSDHEEPSHALFDIVETGDGTDRILATGVRHQPASEIVEALNAYEELQTTI